jgi:hypothetical protein
LDLINIQKKCDVQMEKIIQICNENSVFLILKLILEKPEKTGFFSVGFLENFGLRLGFGC